MRVILDLRDDTVRHLEALYGEGPGYTTLPNLVSYIVSSVADGVRRPGSWERDCVRMMFGDFAGNKLVSEDTRRPDPPESVEQLAETSARLALACDELRRTADWQRDWRAARKLGRDIDHQLGRLTYGPTETTR